MLSVAQSWNDIRPTKYRKGILGLPTVTTDIHHPHDNKEYILLSHKLWSVCESLQMQLLVEVSVKDRGAQL